MKLQALYSFFSGTLRGRLIIGVAAVHAVMMTLFISDLTFRQRAMLLDRQTEQAAALSQALATSAAGWIAANDIAGLEELVDAQRRYPELIFAILTDEHGRVLADTDRSRRGLFLLDLPGITRQTVLARTPELVDVAVPALVGGHKVGWARIGVGQKAAVKTLTRITMSGVIYALAAIISGSLIAWLMGRQITRRLYAIQETISSVSNGNTLARTTLTGTDEAAVLAGEFNKMLDEIAAKDAELQTANTLLHNELTERKKAEETVLQAQQVFRTLIENSPDIIARYDRDCRRTYVNPAYLKIAHITEENLLTRTPVQISPLPPSSAAILQNLLNNVLDSGLSDNVDVVWPKADGIDYWYNIYAFPEYDSKGQVVSVMTVSRDITQRKNTELELQKLNEELEQRVRERTAELEHKNVELERLNRIFVGRELRMVDLKKRIAQLEMKSSHEERQNDNQD